MKQHLRGVGMMTFSFQFLCLLRVEPKATFCWHLLIISFDETLMVNENRCNTIIIRKSKVNFILLLLYVCPRCLFARIIFWYFTDETSVLVCTFLLSAHFYWSKMNQGLWLNIWTSVSRQNRSNDFIKSTITSIARATRLDFK